MDIEGKIKHFSVAVLEEFFSDRETLWGLHFLKDLTHESSRRFFEKTIKNGGDSEGVLNLRNRNEPNRAVKYMLHSLRDGREETGGYVVILVSLESAQRMESTMQYFSS